METIKSLLSGVIVGFATTTGLAVPVLWIYFFSG